MDKNIENIEDFIYVLKLYSLLNINLPIKLYRYYYNNQNKCKNELFKSNNNILYEKYKFLFPLNNNFHKKIKYFSSTFYKIEYKNMCEITSAQGNLEMFKESLKYELNPTWRILAFASIFDNYECFKYCLELNIIPEIFREIELYYIIGISGNIDIVKLFYTKWNESNFKFPIAHLCDGIASGGNIECFEYLYQNDKIAKYEFNNCLSNSINFGNLEILKYYMDNSKPEPSKINFLLCDYINRYDYVHVHIVEYFISIGYNFLKRKRNLNN